MMVRIRQTHTVNSVSICLWAPDAYCERQQCMTTAWINSECYFNDGERPVHMCVCVYIYIYTERFTTMLRRCEYRPFGADFRASSLGKMKQWRCRGVSFSHLSWICHQCCAFPLAPVFRPGMIHTRHLRQSICGGLEWMRYALLLFAGTLPCRSSNCFSVKQSELTGYPSFICQHSRK